MQDVSEARRFLDGLVTNLVARKLLTSVTAQPAHVDPLCKGLVDRSGQMREDHGSAEAGDIILAGRGLWDLVHSIHYTSYAPERNPDQDRQFIEGLSDGYRGIRSQKSPDYFSGHKLGKETSSLSSV